MVSLTTLNYGASFLHFVQAVTVLCLISGLNDTHKNDPPIFKGVYSIMKNLFILRTPNQPPVCDLPALRNITNQMSLDGHPTNDYTPFNEGTIIMHQAFTLGYVDVRYLIFAFFALSSSFQGMEALAGEYRGPRILRFVEYAFSSSVMILAMGVQVGITDIYSLSCMFGLMFTTNILGLIAEVLCFAVENSQSPILSIWFWLVPHILGWLTCLFAYSPLIDAYLVSTRCSDRHPPGFVNVIIFLEFSLFTSFGLVQLYALVRKSLLYASGGYAQLATNLNDLMHRTNVARTPDGLLVQSRTPSEEITYYADLAYVTLSFTAKTLLAWLILAPTLAPAPV